MDIEILLKLNIRLLLLFNRFRFFYAFHNLFSTLNIEIQNKTAKNEKEWKKM